MQVAQTEIMIANSFSSFISPEPLKIQTYIEYCKVIGTSNKSMCSKPRPVQSFFTSHFMPFHIKKQTGQEVRPTQNI